MLDLALVSEEIGRTSADLVMAYAGGLFCGLTVARKGSDAQKQKWIPALIDGRIKFSIGISEPDAGSDVGAIRTSARKDGNDWVLNGHKVWQSGAGAKDNVICLYARTDTARITGRACRCSWSTTTRPGVSMKKLDMLGRYCMGTYEVTLDRRARRRGPDHRRREQGLGLLLSGCRPSASRRGLRCRLAQAVVDLALICQGTQAVRPADRQFPVDRPYAGRHADRGGGRDAR